jgi:predicted peptidase
MTAKHGWEPQRVKYLVERLIRDSSKRYQIDPDRVYLTGFSRGGFGTFQTACAYPELFAAIVPVAGGGEPEQAVSLTTVPTWALHGEADEVVACENSTKMIDAMKKVGCREAKLTTFEGAGHGIVGNVYQNPEIYRWMLERRRE